jgi:predicted nucleic acid-binding protein
MAARLLKFALDTNVLLDAFERHVPACRALLEAGQGGRVQLAVSRTLDDELRFEFVDDALWTYAKGLPRLPRPSAALGHMRLGEASLGYGGVGTSLVGRKGERQVGRNIRDGEHIDGADVWQADAFVTSERSLLKRGEISSVRIIAPATALSEIHAETAP